MFARGSAHYGLFTLAFALYASLPMMASNITFVGSFQQDNQLAVFTLNVSSTTLVEILSVGYAGGPTDIGTVSPGGFDSYLTLFDSRGAFLAENDDWDGAPPDPNTGQAFDAQLTQTLDPGIYALVLTQYGNYAVSQNILDGFSESSNPSYTTDPGFSPSNGCSGFEDTSGSCRSGSYVIQVLNSGGADASYALLDGQISLPNSPTPEPSSIVTLSFALMLMLCVQRKIHGRAWTALPVGRSSKNT